MELGRGYFPKENWCAGTEGGRSGEKAKTTDVYCCHHSYELILSMYSAEVFWKTKCVNLVFFSIAKYYCSVGLQKSWNSFETFNCRGGKYLHCFIHLRIKIMKISIGKSYFCAHPKYNLAIELTYPFKHGYFELVAVKW